MAESPSELSVEIEKLERKHAENPEGRYFVPLANAYRKLGAAEHAEALLRDGLRRHPDYLSAHVVLGRCLADQRASDAAVEEFRYVLSIDPHNLIALRSLAEIALADHRTDEAVHWYRELSAVDPMNDEARRALEELGALDTPDGGPYHGEPDTGDDWLHPTDEFGLDQPLPPSVGTGSEDPELRAAPAGGGREDEEGAATGSDEDVDGSERLQGGESLLADSGRDVHGDAEGVTRVYEPIPGLELSEGYDPAPGADAAEIQGFEPTADAGAEPTEPRTGTDSFGSFEGDRDEPASEAGRGSEESAPVEHGLVEGGGELGMEQVGDRETEPFPDRPEGEHTAGTDEAHEEFGRAPGESAAYAGFDHGGAEEMEDVLSTHAWNEDRAGDSFDDEGRGPAPARFGGEPEDEDEGAGALATETIAELYARQGFYSRSAEVLREVIRRRGGDPTLERRLEEIEALAAGERAPGPAHHEPVLSGEPDGDALKGDAFEEAGVEPEPWAAGGAPGADTYGESFGDSPDEEPAQDEDAFADSFAHGFHAPEAAAAGAPETPPASIAATGPAAGGTIASYLRDLASWRHGDADVAAISAPAPAAATGDTPGHGMTDAEDVAAIWSPEGETAAAAAAPYQDESDDAEDVAAIWAPDGEADAGAVAELEPWEATPASAEPGIAPGEPAAEMAGTGSAADEPYPWEEPEVEEPLRTTGAGELPEESGAASNAPDAYPGGMDGSEVAGEEHARSLDDYLPYDQEPAPARAAAEPEDTRSPAEGSAASTGTQPPVAAQEEDDDLESFQTWLRSLKR